MNMRQQLDTYESAVARDTADQLYEPSGARPGCGCIGCTVMRKVDHERFGGLQSSTLRTIAAKRANDPRLPLESMNEEGRPYG